MRLKKKQIVTSSEWFITGDRTLNSRSNRTIEYLKSMDRLTRVHAKTREMNRVSHELEDGTVRYVLPHVSAYYDWRAADRGAHDLLHHQLVLSYEPAIFFVNIYPSLREINLYQLSRIDIVARELATSLISQFSSHHRRTEQWNFLRVTSRC